MKKCASIGDIIELKAQLAPRGITVHLRDACGQQSLWLEQEADAALRQEITDFFAEKQLGVQFAEDNKNFWIG